MVGFSEKDIIELTECVNTWKAQSGIASLGHINGNNGNGKIMCFGFCCIISSHSPEKT
jgi:hypothetical protein